MLLSQFDRIAKLKEKEIEGVVVLGSTGTIGRASLDIIAKFPQKYKVVGLTAHTNARLLSQQRKLFGADVCVLTGEQHSGLNGEFLYGIDQATSLCERSDVDTVICGIVGLACLKPLLCAIRNGKKVLLANKECVVSAGKFIHNELKKSDSAVIVPVDSEHNGLFQLLLGEKTEDIERYTLTASGGPFLRKSAGELEAVTPAEAVKHPKWKMGAKISVDSATLMNKALEVIEAHWLFSAPPDNIDVVIHPQSIVHALVHFKDGSVKVQASNPDMRGAIGFALGYPFGRLERCVEPLELGKVSNLVFEELDFERFKAVKLAFNILNQNTDLGCVMNIANEVAVARFIRGDIRFIDIVPFVENALERYSTLKLKCIEDVFELYKELNGELENRVLVKG